MTTYGYNTDEMAFEQTSRLSETAQKVTTEWKRRIIILQYTKISRKPFFTYFLYTIQSTLINNNHKISLFLKSVCTYCMYRNTHMQNMHITSDDTLYLLFIKTLVQILRLTLSLKSIFYSKNYIRNIDAMNNCNIIYI